MPPRRRPESNIRTTIKRFVGPYRFLSNFYPATVMLDGMEYPTLEHAFQAAKSLNAADRRKIRLVSTPGRAKILGRAAILRPNWDKIKVGIMLRLVESKFEHHSLRQQLIDTNPAILVEGNWWGDDFWGWDLRTGKGRNMLGLCLMMVRENALKGPGSPHTEARDKEYERISKWDAKITQMQHEAYVAPEPLPNLPWAWDHSGKKQVIK